jgi:hypothetical protein
MRVTVGCLVKIGERSATGSSSETSVLLCLGKRLVALLACGHEMIHKTLTVTEYYINRLYDFNDVCVMVMLTTTPSVLKYKMF